MRAEQIGRMHCRGRHRVTSLHSKAPRKTLAPRLAPGHRIRGSSADARAVVEGQLDYLQKRGPIRMCVAPDWMPIEGIDEHGRHVGMAARSADN